MKRACPNCHDGYVWTREGPTGKACQTCKGKAYIGDDDEEVAEHEEYINRQRQNSHESTE